MTINWYVDKGLAVLSGQLRSRFPGITIYNVGNAEHQAGTSDHNPSTEPHDYGAVDASDYMIRPGIFTAHDAEWLFQTLLHWRDPRIAYVIYNHRIFSSTIRPWEIREYTGTNPHTDHVHGSVNDLHETDTDLWRLDLMLHNPMIPLDDYTIPLLRYGMDDRDYEGYNMVARLQRELKITDDGRYGDETATAVRRRMGGGDGHTVDEQAWVIIYGLSRRPPT